LGLGDWVEHDQCRTARVASFEGKRKCVDREVEAATRCDKVPGSVDTVCKRWGMILPNLSRSDTGVICTVAGARSREVGTMEA